MFRLKIVTKRVFRYWTRADPNDLDALLSFFAPITEAFDHG
jgi:hypothetical protein